jgi:imidazolonepropionase-like amidohydrolase
MVRPGNFRLGSAVEHQVNRLPLQYLVAAFAGFLATRPLAAQGAPDTTPAVALLNARIYRSPEAAPLDNGVILISGGVITAVGTRTSVKIPPAAKLVDCSGAVIVPGFWNSHVHFTEPHWARSDTLPAAALTAQLQAMLTRYGFVRVLDTGSPLENTLALRRRVDRREVLGPAISTTGPGFVPRGASPFYILPERLPELRSAAGARALVSRRIGDGADAIKLFTGSFAAPTRVVAMPLKIVRAATAEAHRQHRQVMAHPSNDAGVSAALDGGVDILAHTTPDGGPWDARLISRMLRAHLALIPTLKLWTFELSRRGVDSASAQKFVQVAVEQLRAFSRSGGEVLFGTDVGYMTDYDPTDEYRYMERAGMSFRQILAALTTAPARRLGGSKRATGRLVAGMDADLVLLDGDPATDIRALSRVRSVWRQGQVIYPMRYGFVTTLGHDSVSVERIERSAARLVTDGVDRWPFVRRRHTEFDLNQNGTVRHMVMDVRTPNGRSPRERGRRVTADFSSDKVKISVGDSGGVRDTAFATGGAITVPHVSMMYSVIELEVAAALRKAAASGLGPGDSVLFRQFYPDRDVGPSFTLHRGWVHLQPGGKVVLRHDWLSGVGDVTVDGSGRMLSYSGMRSTYKVAVTRTTTPPDIESIGDRLAAAERRTGPQQLSVRDTARATIGAATFSVDYGRPLARGRTLLGNVIAYDRVWRTGANAATQFTTSAPITLAGLSVPAGTYTLWTVPHVNGRVDLIVNQQTGQWGTEYGRAHDLGTGAMKSEILGSPVDEFTIAIEPTDARHGTLVMTWGTFRWTAPIAVQ